MSSRRFFATAELLLMLCDNLLSQRDMVAVMKASKKCHITILPLVWRTVVGVQNLMALLSKRSRLLERHEGDTTIYIIPTSFSPAAIERFRYHAPLVHHIHLYDHQALFKWEGLSSLHVLNFPLTPQLRTIEICKWPTSARAVQDLEWVRFLTSPFTTSLRVTSHSKEAMQIWTSDDCYEALKIVEQRGARLLDLSIFANRTNKEKIDTKEKKDTQGRAVFARLYDAERLIERWTTITCLSVSVYQVDLKSLELFGSMHLRSLHIQGFGSSSQNWGTISACNAPFADLTELKVHNFLPQDVLALLSCHALIDGVLSLSLSYASISSITTPVINCMQRIAASSLGLTEFSVEFHVPVYNSLVNWLSQLVGLPLRRLLVRGCYISMFTFTETVPQWLSLQSLNLPGHTTTVECFGVFASCPNLHYVELYNVDSGRVPALLPNAGQDLVVRAEFTLGRMTKRELKTLASRLLSSWRSVTLVDTSDASDDATTTGDRNSLAYLCHLLCSEVL